MTKDQFDRILSDAKSLYWERADADTRAEFVSKAKANIEFEKELLRKQEAELPGIYWYKLQTGSNVLRLVTVPFQYRAHEQYVERDHLAHHQKLKCAADGNKGGVCALCDNGHPARPRWVIGALINSAGNKPYYLDIDWKIFQGIKNLAQEPEWGDPTQYNINIQLNWNESYTSKDYVVIPYPKSALNDLEKVEAERFSKDRMTRMVEPISDDELSNMIMNDNFVTVKSVEPQLLGSGDE